MWRTAASSGEYKPGMLSVCIAGATGWTGTALVQGVLDAPDLRLRSAVSRSAAGGEIGGAPVYASVAEALDGVDVVIDYTSVEAVKANALAAIEAGVAVVIGTSGLTADDFAETTPTGRARAAASISAKSSADRPDVPITTATPASIAASAFALTASTDV